MKKTFKLWVAHSPQAINAVDEHIDVINNDDVVRALTQMIERFSLLHGATSLVKGDITIHMNADSFDANGP